MVELLTYTIKPNIATNYFSINTPDFQVASKLLLKTYITLCLSVFRSNVVPRSATMSKSRMFRNKNANDAPSVWWTLRPARMSVHWTAHTCSTLTVLTGGWTTTKSARFAVSTWTSYKCWSRTMKTKRWDWRQRRSKLEFWRSKELAFFVLKM